MKKITISILVILLLIASNFAISDTTFTQTPVTLNANKILPKEVITGSNYASSSSTVVSPAMSTVKVLEVSPAAKVSVPLAAV